MSANALDEWLARRQKTLTDLMYETRISWSTLCRARKGAKVRLATARKISRATGWEVPVSSLTNEADEDEDTRRPRGKSRRAA